MRENENNCVHCPQAGVERIINSAEGVYEMQSAMLIFISDQGEIEKIATSDLDYILNPACPYYDEILGSYDEDPIIRRNVVSDLSRVGARFAEVPHGQFVIALLD